MKVIGALYLWFLRTALAQSYSCDNYQTIDKTDSYTIESPGYPDYYSGDILCRWTVECPRGYNCHLDCTVFEIVEPSSCEKDRLVISKTGNPQFYDAEEVCQSGPFSTTSKRSKISVGLETESDTSGGRFKCEVTARRASSPRTRRSNCRCGERRQNRIVGGEPAGKYEYPMMVGLADLRSTHILCGGVIISTKSVMTAAHCTKALKLEHTGVVVATIEGGEGVNKTDAVWHAIDRYIIHPQYNEDTTSNDIALVIVKEAFKYDDRVGPVCLPFKYVGNEFNGANATIAGWGLQEFGANKSDVLLKAVVQVLANDLCVFLESDIIPSKMCTLTPGKDACQMDSGGPLFYEEETSYVFSIGIISSGRGCGNDADPGIYTRVTSFLDWIKSNAVDNDFCVK